MMHKKVEFNQPHFIKSIYMKDMDDSEMDEQTKQDELEAMKEQMREAKSF